MCFPGSENSKSQIVEFEHPLGSRWESYRKGISVSEDNSLDNLELLTQEVVFKRLNFYPLLKFEPNQALNKL
jgi:hypothetical protein